MKSGTTTPAAATPWERLGDHVAIAHPDGARTGRGWLEVDATLIGRDR